jgi:L-ascorbate metabolism protein UlaG (beta-lactamase superfamily)
VEPDLLLITHEHFDHNAVDVVGGSPQILRSTAGTFESPVGEVVAVASEHDDAAGTQRGPNTIFRFTLDGLKLSHFGDLGQSELRGEQREAIGEVDVLLLPVGGGPTVGGDAAAAIVRALRPRLVVPMHYRTEAVNFLDPPDEFLAALGARVERIDESELEAERLLGTAEDPTVALLAPPSS